MPPAPQGPAGDRARAAAGRAAWGTWLRQVRACAALTAQPNDPVEYRATVRALRTTAERALAAHQEATQLGKELGTLARVMAPALLAQPGVGPVTAAQVLISWSHRAGCARRPPLPCWPAPHPSRRPPGGWSATGSTAAAIASSTGRCTPASCSASATTSPPSAMWPAAPPRAERARDPPLPQAHGRSPAVSSPGAANPDPGHGVTARRVSAEATLSTGGGRDPVDTPTTRGGRRPRRRRRQRPALPGRAAGSCLRGLRPAGCIPAPLQQHPAP